MLPVTQYRASSSIIARGGVGLRSVHHQEFLRAKQQVAWLEVHSENFFAVGGPLLLFLTRLRQDYPISLHGVGLSIGSADPLSQDHLLKLKNLVNIVEPGFVSEHLSWSSVAGIYANDLLPVPYTEEALRLFIEKIDYVQEYLGRQILIENPSTYLEYSCSSFAEVEFLTNIAKHTGCGILLDLNNIYVSSVNHGFDPAAYISKVPSEQVKEIHLAGHTRLADDLLIDSHDSLVCDKVWELYQLTMKQMGAKPTLIEWDDHLPELPILLKEADKANLILDRL